MAFEKGHKLGEATQFTSDNQPPPERKTHSGQRCHIARKVLSMRVKLDSFTEEELRKSYPELDKSMTGEELATLIQLNKAILLQDTAAYNALLNSAYGAPKQELGLTDNEGNDVPPITVFRIPDNGRSST